jgi:hypothetical protein
VEEILDRGLGEGLCPEVVTQRLHRCGELLALPSVAGYTCLHYACGAGREHLGDIKGGFGAPATRFRIAQSILRNVEVDVNAPGTPSWFLSRGRWVP